ncbi:hypothetical protein B0F90DRAFT_1667885 [Multifurca ochricompacta]|uniref:DUF6535 domain-containing protein n=1 Tax=Multifurca ochricompacta TaxID=376703 RepID=A0AAD4QNQ3_9AGAM|nr:hypothetical protein B0F90DRAFT_1667885 [Multifurca ochricompacta]
MSQTPYGTVNLGSHVSNVGFAAAVPVFSPFSAAWDETGGHRHSYPPHPAPDHASQGGSNFVDGSGPLFSMYVEMTGEEDKKMAESWKGDADGILVFTGLFSAAVAALIAVSIQDLRASSQDNSAFYIAKTYQLLAEANGSPVSIPSTLLDPSKPFNPPNYAVWVNSLWFLSLAISLTCALLATLLQQWARRYIKITQPRYSPHKRARIRAFFAGGVDKLHLPWAVEALPALLHLSLFCFSSASSFFIQYQSHRLQRRGLPLLCPTFDVSVVPCYRILPHSPFLQHSTRERFNDLKDQYSRWFLQGLGKITEEMALRPSSEIDGRALMWTFESLDEDHELELFFSSIPAFCKSAEVKDPLGAFIKPNEEKLLWALIGLMDRTSASNLVSNQVKEQRSMICVKAMDAASLPLNEEIFDRVFSEEWNGLLSSVEFGHFLRKSISHGNPGVASYSQCAVSIIISRVQEHNDRWFELVTSQLGVPGPVLRSYLAIGDSVLLANCVYITRYMIGIYSSEGWTHTAGSKSKTLESVSNFNIHSTLPELQHDFCDLWNELALMARNTDAHHVQLICILALKHLRNVYISLHYGTLADPTAFSAYTYIGDPILDKPSSYPLCTIESHRHALPPNGTSTTPEATTSAAANTADVPVTSSTIPDNGTTSTTDPGFAGPDSGLAGTSPTDSQSASSLVVLQAASASSLDDLNIASNVSTLELYRNDEGTTPTEPHPPPDQSAPPIANVIIGPPS